MPDVNIYESVTVAEDMSVIRHLSLSVNDSAGISEIFGSGNPFISDSVSVLEYISLYCPENFNKFLRGYPYVEITLSQVDPISLGRGYEQLLDRWGRTKKQFNIRFPVFVKSEIKEIRDFYDDHYGKVFNFTEPIWNVVYSVRITNNSWQFSRSAYDTYFAEFSLVEYL